MGKKKNIIDPYEVGSSSQPPGPTEVAEKLDQMYIQHEEEKPVPPASESLKFALRPRKGISGVKCIVKANHFFAELPDKDLHQYDVTITPEATTFVNRQVLKKLVDSYKKSCLGDRLPAYDGRNSLYTAGPFPFISEEFRIILVDDDKGTSAPRREREFKVVIKFAARADLHHLNTFLQGRQSDAPQDVALKGLNIILRELTDHMHTPVGRSFYFGDPERRKSLGNGLVTCRGFHQSIRPTQMGLSLNIDMSCTTFIEPLPVIEFVKQLLNRDDSSTPLSDADRVKIKKALRGVKIETTHRGSMRGECRISGLTSQATWELTCDFPVDGRVTKKSLVEYFYETYDYVIQYTQWPCLQVGNTSKHCYLPMEVCKILKGQRYSEGLNGRQIRALLEMTCQRPQDREREIREAAKDNAYSTDDYAREFGIKISEELAQFEARILPAPRLKYHDSGIIRDCLPEVGCWNMLDKKWVNGGTVNNWLCINFSRTVPDMEARHFCDALASTCQRLGMAFAPQPILPPITGDPNQVEGVLRTYYDKARKIDLVIAILPNEKGSLYGDLKRICETDLGLVSQCLNGKKVSTMNRLLLESLAAQINVKVGGRNTVLLDTISRHIPLVSDRPTIIFGAYVTHPWEDASKSNPSIAAVVASQDWPELTKYVGLVCAQAPHQELIQELEKLTRELLISFHQATKVKPQQIIFYRDGVSEGRRYQVLLYELYAIRKACASLEPDYQPPVTFVVAQKRHHTRLFAINHSDSNSVDISGDIFPGTVVDSKICHPTEFDFYLCSHAGIQEMSRPAHYHVLWDENNFTADSFQQLTYDLCYTNARANQSATIVPPVYYAHLAAARARFYVKPDESDSGSTRGSGANAAVRPLPAVKDDVKKVMFYC